jgi:hypothetical protein
VPLPLALAAGHVDGRPRPRWWGVT